MSLLDLRVYSATLFPIDRGIGNPIVLADDRDTKDMSGYLVVPVQPEGVYWMPFENQYLALIPGEVLILPRHHTGVFFTDELRADVDQLLGTQDHDCRSLLTQTKHPKLHTELIKRGEDNLGTTVALLIEIKLCEIVKGDFGLTLPDYFHMQPMSKTQDHIKNIGCMLLEQYENGSVFRSDKVDRLTELLLIEVFESFFLNVETESNKLYRGLFNSRIRNSVLAILQNPGHDWSVAELSQKAHMSRSIFAERFKEALNETPLNFVRQCRIQQAKACLLESSASLQQISSNCGYASLSSFIKSFDRVTGLSPSAWRKKQTADRMMEMSVDE